MDGALAGAQLFYCETISNPVLMVAHLSRLARLCQAAGVASVVDNTFATPYLCNPAKLGFDCVVHSATKYIGGHSDLIGGVVCTSRERRSSLPIPPSTPAAPWRPSRPGCAPGGW